MGRGKKKGNGERKREERKKGLGKDEG
jgi:hypothetical protein